MNVENVGNVWVEQWEKGAQRGSMMDGKPKDLEENDRGRGRGMEGMCSEVWSRKQWNFVTLMHTHSAMLRGIFLFSSFTLSLSHTPQVYSYLIGSIFPHCVLFGSCRNMTPFPKIFLFNVKLLWQLTAKSSSMLFIILPCEQSRFKAAGIQLVLI